MRTKSNRVSFEANQNFQRSIVFINFEKTAKCTGIILKTSRSSIMFGTSEEQKYKNLERPVLSNAFDNYQYFPCLLIDEPVSQSYLKHWQSELTSQLSSSFPGWLLLPRSCSSRKYDQRNFSFHCLFGCGQYKLRMWLSNSRIAQNRWLCSFISFFFRLFFRVFLLNNAGHRWIQSQCAFLVFYSCGS